MRLVASGGETLQKLLRTASALSHVRLQ